MLLACHPQARPDSAASEVTVLEVSKPAYRPAKGAPTLADEATMCSAWSLDADQAAAFFRLSKPLGEGELHDYGWLPCTIEGRVQARGRIWSFEINAAGTSIWRDGDEALLLGCAQAACEPFVILMPETGEP
jgi:hypothetical protein